MPVVLLNRRFKRIDYRPHTFAAPNILRQRLLDCSPLLPNDRLGPSEIVWCPLLRMRDKPPEPLVVKSVGHTEIMP